MKPSSEKQIREVYQKRLLAGGCALTIRIITILDDMLDH